MIKLRQSCVSITPLFNLPVARFERSPFVCIVSVLFSHVWRWWPWWWWWWWLLCSHSFVLRSDRARRTDPNLKHSKHLPHKLKLACGGLRARAWVCLCVWFFWGGYILEDTVSARCRYGHFWSRRPGLKPLAKALGFEGHCHDRPSYVSKPFITIL